MEKDKLFEETPRKQFAFDESVASVFDDMLERSVPYYKEVRQLCVALALKNLSPNSRVYDLGCSTGTLLLDLHRASPCTLNLTGIDNSDSMLDRARQKSIAYGADIQWEAGDIMTCQLQPCRIVFCNYILQFIRPLQRQELVSRIHESLEEEGMFIFSEKVISEDKRLHKQMIDLYYAYKKEQGYSELEIMQKREALENVLVPYTEEENRQMLKEAGFSHVETLFRWVNFATYVAIK